MTKLRIAPGLTLPLDITTQAIGIIAKRRVGKSYLARKLYEQLLHAGQQVVIVDPKGDHWGVRSSADGKGPGFPVVILGGEHGDVPLEAGSGEIVAKLVAEERVSALLDLSFFRKHEVATFMTAFMEGLYRLKAKEVFRTPMMLIVDEADAIMPQKPQPNEARMLGAGDDIVRRGGQRGIGCGLITQRTAVLNKNVLTQCQVLVALRTIAPQDLDAMNAWVDVHGTVEERETLMESLPSLPVGDAWFWSPGWPTEAGIFKRVHVDPIETFDSGATPKSGEKRIEPKNLADVDLGALTKQMAATIERAKADDPKALRAEIATLKKQLAAAPSKERVVEKVVVDERAIKRAVDAAVKPYADKLRAIQRVVTPAGRIVSALVDQFNGIAKETEVPVVEHPVAVREPATASAPRPRVQATPRPSATPGGTSSLTGARLKIARALAELAAIGVHAATRAQLGFYVGMTFSGGYGSNTLGAMKTDGLIDYPESGLVALTDAGCVAAGPVDPPVDLDDLHARVRGHLTGLSERIFDAMVALGESGSVTRDELGELTGATYSGGYGSNTLGALHTAGIVRYPTKGSVGPSNLLFPEGLS